MKITIENTTKIVRLSKHRFPLVAQDDDIKCRVWEGVTETGIRVQCLIPRISTFAANDQEQFIRELEEKKPPTAELNAFPIRMVI